MTGISNRILLSIGLVVLAVGMVDSLISREWDLLAVFVVAGLVLKLGRGRHYPEV